MAMAKWTKDRSKPSTDRNYWVGGKLVGWVHKVEGGIYGTHYYVVYQTKRGVAFRPKRRYAHLSAAKAVVAKYAGKTR